LLAARGSELKNQNRGDDVALELKMRAKKLDEGREEKTVQKCCFML
jgi:hypothetical protein